MIITPNSTADKAVTSKSCPAERPTPLPSAPGDPFNVLGEPFVTFARLLVAADEAKQRLHAARVEGEQNGIFAAEMAYANAMGDVLAFKHHGAAVFMLYARFAAELHPGAVEPFLLPVFGRRLDTLTDAAAKPDAWNVRTLEGSDTKAA